MGASEFAVRERVAGRLIDLGVAIVPELRRLVADATDPEVKLRANQIIQQLSDGDMAGRIEAFLAGAEADFPGWRVTRAILGDTGGVRELFIELMQEHPEILASMEQATRDRVMALEKAMSGVEDKMFKQFQFPSRADTFALLLPVVDPNLPLGDRFEPVMLSVLVKEEASKIRRDAQLSLPFRGLMTRWIGRSKQENRDTVLRLTMQWDLPIGMELGVQTLEETHDNETLASALQAIARFGGADQVPSVLPLLGDQRPVSEQGFVRGQEMQTFLGDVAMATIARLYKVELTELGIPRSADHPTFSFLIPDVGFASADKEARDSARAKIDELVKEKQPVVPVPLPD